ncbi:putative zinc metallopeptidase [Listeria floridensis FSL S10-1187]|uniref:Zinc metallopeptidase n=1 Tax=Listeria floridensis FSL S10-1187 TaxID=1265817 RepID=A0ABN0RIJ9_9LIST|nr:putative zinc metallopeptidase [Listeria floridensis FSL S10-1187]
MLLFLIFIIHEGIHGIFFKVFGGTNSKVRFGFKNGMLYATSPNSRFSKKQFLCISLAPFVVITIVLTVLLVLGILPRMVFVFLAAIHGGGCVGDFYWTYLLSEEPENIEVEDTESGFNIYIKAE